MISIIGEKYLNCDCYQLSNGILSVWLSREFGPRIIGLSYLDGENLLAEIPGQKLSAGNGPEYTPHGGHRLWYAPERPETTYLPDDDPPQIEEIEGGFRVVQDVDTPTGIQKSWEMVLDQDQARLTINHKLMNLGDDPFELAPWAVTMLKPGGLACLPMQEKEDDEHGLWPNRTVVIWPYTELESSCLQLTDRAIFIRADLQEGALKLGAPNPQEWIAYSNQGVLFTKSTAYDPHDRYVDRGASSQIYCNPDMIELETLGPVVNLQPGESTEYIEVWKIYPKGEWPQEIGELYKNVE